MNRNHSSRNRPAGQDPYPADDDATRIIPSYDAGFYDDTPTEVLSHEDAPTRPFNTRSTQKGSSYDFDAPTQVIGGASNYHQQGHGHYMEEPPTVPFNQYSASAPPYRNSSRPSGSQPQTSHAIHPKTGMPVRLMQMQLLPCFLGWIVGYTLFGFLLNFYDLAISLLGDRFGLTSSYGSEHTSAIQAMLTAPESTMSNIQLWVVSTALLYGIAFSFAGYTATRLTRVSPFKQSLGIMLWHGLFVVITVIFSFIPVIAQPFHIPSLTLLFAENFPYGFLLFAGSAICIFTGSLLGSFFGLRYGKQVVQEQERNIRD
ncbi:hypothetical protein [Rothia sp. P7208]|uniref:hypothetical protein n=1 Tax=Rothia sp. P7208 TaxID=3402660 RepID=UPI003ACED194